MRIIKPTSARKFLKNPYLLLDYLTESKVTRVIPDKCYLKMLWKAHFDTPLNLEKPCTFNEKLQWLKLYNRKPEYIQMVDKYEVRRYIAEKIGEKYLIPLLGVWQRPEDIDFVTLPDSFVLKCNNDCGSVVICKDKSKLNKEAAIKKLERNINIGAYWQGREWPYKNVKPCVIAEKYLEDASTRELRDYKFHCFNGEPKFVLVCNNRFGDGGVQENFYTPDWKLMDVKRPEINHITTEVQKPATLEQMIELAKVLSMNIPFVRVDFYDVNGDIYFGELTFFPASGLRRFEPEEWDFTFGSWINLPNNGKNVKDCRGNL